MLSVTFDVDNLVILTRYNDAAANTVAMEKVHNDKLREVSAGHDGTWVAHPDLVKVAKKIFDEHLGTPNQLYVRREDVVVTAKDLLNTKISGGKISEGGIRLNVSIALQYMEAWLRGFGCVPIHNLMEDAATAEISRSALWQWVKHQAKMDNGKCVTGALVKKAIDDEIDAIKSRMGNKFAESKFLKARDYLWRTSQGGEYADFLTTLMYDDIVSVGEKSSL